MIRRGVVSAVLGIAVVAGLLVAARWWDLSDAGPIKPAVLDADAVRPPSPLDPNRVSSSPALDLSSPTGMQLEKGGWVQVANPDGTLAQQYSAQRLDPEPGQWLAMEQPRAVFYLEDGRVVTLRAERARTYVPQRAMERGDFEGDVIAKVFAPGSDGTVHLGADSPSMVFEASAANVDFLHGTLRCVNDARVTTPTIRFEGEDLDLQMSADRRTVESLHVARLTGPLVIDRSMSKALDQASGAPPERAGGGLAPALVVARGATPRPEVSPFHRVTLTKNVRIVRYTGGPSSSFGGDHLLAVLSLEGDLVDTGGLTIPGAPEVAGGMGSSTDVAEFAALPLAPRLVPWLVMASAPSTLPAHPSSQGTAGGARSTRGDMIAVWADGPLEVVRASEADSVPATRDGVLVFLDGEPMRVGDDGGRSLVAPELNLELDRVDGATRLRSMVARGGVVASDVGQTLWSSSLRVRFTAVPGTTSRPSDDSLVAASEIERADAEGGVELQLREGARAWGDRVQAWPTRRQAELHGPGVQVVRGNALLHDVERLQVDEAARTVMSPGSGSASIFAEVIVPDDVHGRVGALNLEGLHRQTRAVWKESMRFVDRGNAGATLLVVGEVDLVSEPDAVERDSLEAGSVQLEFVPSIGTARQPQGAFGAAGGPLELTEMQAIGGVRLQSQVWPGAKDGSAGQPELFQLKCDEVTWFAATKEAIVPVAGSILINRPAESGQPASSGPSMIGSLGVTGFSWKQSMHLENRTDGLSQFRMELGVEIRHLGLDRKSRTTVTCDRAIAVMERTGSGDAGAGAPVEIADGRTDAQAEALEFGTAGTLRRLIAEGRCKVRTPEYDIDCESMEYDTTTQLAVLKARQGRVVTISPLQGGSQLNAVEAIWDLATGRIQVKNARGDVSR
ncbi:MAG: hypothetical protein O2819_03680 [Planctomycetota bacterium]|nr:hypothetical protein [Planctomycetota bacterium]MDA1105575.1 hypothetical protein [Planctomycetota bacterium]